MSLSVGGADYYLGNLINSSSESKASKLQSSLGSLDAAKATDEELLESCKEYEAYRVEQMFKGMEKTIPKDEEEEENEYMEQFGDMLYEQVATSIADRGELGLAQQLYEAMKREQGVL